MHLVPSLIKTVTLMLLYVMSMYGCKDAKREMLNTGSTEIDFKQSKGACEYTNLFSSQKECRSYLGSTWTVETAKDQCLSQQDSRFLPNQVWRGDFLLLHPSLKLDSELILRRLGLQSGAETVPE